MSVINMKFLLSCVAILWDVETSLNNLPWHIHGDLLQLVFMYFIVWFYGSELVEYLSSYTSVFYEYPTESSI